MAHHERDALPAGDEPVDRREQPLSRPRVQIVGGLVEQEHPRLPEEPTCQRGERAFPAGQREHRPAQVRGQAQLGEQRARPLGDRPVVGEAGEVVVVALPRLDPRQRRQLPTHAELVGEGALRGRVGEQLLEVGDGGRQGGLASDADRPARRTQLAGDEAQQGALARAVAADE